MIKSPYQNYYMGVSLREHIADLAEMEGRTESYMVRLLVIEALKARGAFNAKALESLTRASRPVVADPQ